MDEVGWSWGRCYVCCRPALTPAPPLFLSRRPASRQDGAHYVHGRVANGGRSRRLCVVWKKGVAWAGVKTHMGYNQEAYDAECAALARALESASQRSPTPERVTIFSDAQAAIRRMASDEPGPGQQYAIQARKHLAALRRSRPGITIEIWWCPAHKGVAGNEKADEWAKIAAEEPDTRGMEWLSYDYGGRTEGRAMPLPRSLANLKREISEKKWAEARQWVGGRTSKTKYRMPKSQKPDGAVAGSTKRLASRFYQIKTGHCLTRQYLNWTKNRPTPQCWWCRYPNQTREHLFKVCLELKAQQKILWAEVRKETGKGKDRWKIRASWRTRGVGGRYWTFSPPRMWEGGCWPTRMQSVRWRRRSCGSSWGSWERGTPLFLPTPDSMASAGTV